MTTSIMYSGNLTSTYYSTITPPRTLKGEYLDYKFPINIVPIQYELTLSDDSYPARWYIFGRNNDGPWKLLDQQTKYETFSTLVSGFPPPSGVFLTPMTQMSVDTIRIHVTVSTGRSTKIKQFTVYDRYGQNMSFLVPFCTSTNSLHHSGSLNFSRIDNFSIDADLQTDFYGVGHETIEIDKGMISDPTR